MKKIPTLFKREFKDHKVVKVLPEFTDELCKKAYFLGQPTIKFDGSCCAIINGKFFKRYDAKKGKAVPDNAIKCQEEPDPVTGHLPCWVPVDENNPADKWFIKAYQLFEKENGSPIDGTYEAVGKHFQGNPYGFEFDILVQHGKDYPFFDKRLKSFEELKEFLKYFNHEGLVYWLEGQPICKIKRTDFGYEWPIIKRSDEKC
jgi:hypothetical protein